MRSLAWLLLLGALLLTTPAYAENQLGIEWRDAATIRVDWSTPGQVSCIYVEDRATGLCGEFGSKLVGFIVYAGQSVQLRAGAVVLAAADIPDNPFPLPMTAAWTGSVLRVTIAEPGPNRCLWLVGNYLLDTSLPDSCGTTTYDIAALGQSADYSPINRWLQLIDNGRLVYQMPVPPYYQAALPLVVGP